MYHDMVYGSYSKGHSVQCVNHSLSKYRLSRAAGAKRGNMRMLTRVRFVWHTDGHNIIVAYRVVNEKPVGEST